MTKTKHTGNRRNNRPEYLGGLTLAQVARQNQERARALASRDERKDRLVAEELSQINKQLDTVGIAVVHRTAINYFSAVVSKLKEQYRGNHKYAWQSTFDDTTQQLTTFTISRRRG